MKLSQKQICEVKVFCNAGLLSTKMWVDFSSILQGFVYIFVTSDNF